MRTFSLALAAVLGFAVVSVRACAQAAFPAEESGLLHSTGEWESISAHLPDPANSDAKTLEITAAPLRARHYPSEAVRFYNDALQRGGDPVSLMKKMGIACLEMQQVDLARTYFQHAVRLKKSDAGSWNNLGASEFILRNTNASYHANLA